MHRILLLLLLSPFVCLSQVRSQPLSTFIFQAQGAMPPSVEKFLVPPLRALDVAVLVNVDGDRIKVGLYRDVAEADVRAVINGTGAVSVGPGLPGGPHPERKAMTVASHATWVALHPHLYPEGPHVKAAPSMPWGTITDPAELEAAKQAWFAEHALICPLAPSPRCIGTPVPAHDE